MGEQIQQAADRQRIWRGRALRQARRREPTLDRGISGESLRAPARHDSEDPGLGWTVAMGADGFPFAAASSARHSVLLQPEGVGLKYGPAQAGVLCVAEILYGDKRERHRSRSVRSEVQPCVRS